jgi:transposase
MSPVCLHAHWRTSSRLHRWRGAARTTPHCDILHADKGYDANAIRQQVERRGTMPNIPPKANRKWKNCFSPFLYRNRNAIERMFCRLKDFRRVATRYDRNAVNFLAAVCIAAAVSYWL